MNKSGTFASRLESLLQLCSITKAELSRRTGISRSSITHYVKGDWEGKQDAVYAIAEATGVNEAWLMGYDVPLYKAERTPLGITTDTTGQRIKTARENAGMTREELADALGVSCRDIEKWEWDVCKPEYKMQKSIATALNVPIRSIYHGIIFEMDKEEQERMALAVDLIARQAYPNLYTDEFELDGPLEQAIVKIADALETLNKEGIEEAVKRVEELTEIAKYKDAK